MVSSWDHGIAMSTFRGYRAGESLEDYCRACKTDRMHTVIVVDETHRPIRVSCGFCRSEHNYRGGPRVEPSGGPPRSEQSREAPPGQGRGGRPDQSRGIVPPVHHELHRAPPQSREPAPIVSERERIRPAMAQQDDGRDLEMLLRRIIREEAGITAVAPAAKWRGGTFALRPATPGLQ